MDSVLSHCFRQRALSGVYQACSIYGPPFLPEFAQGMLKQLYFPILVGGGICVPPDPLCVLSKS